ncbi:MAG TPA: hypothetical protein PK263_05655 [bacterium]|nr:hypothetical protein [bacterium]
MIRLPLKFASLPIARLGHKSTAASLRRYHYTKSSQQLNRGRLFYISGGGRRVRGASPELDAAKQRSHDVDAALGY